MYGSVVCQICNCNGNFKCVASACFSGIFVTSVPLFSHQISLMCRLACVGSAMSFSLDTKLAYLNAIFGVISLNYASIKQYKSLTHKD